jgi:hypothetical protein
VPSRAFKALMRGEIDVDSYALRRLARAMAPLRSRLQAADFRAVAALVQQRLRSDPVLACYLARLVRPLENSGDGPPPSSPRGVR